MNIYIDIFKRALYCVKRALIIRVTDVTVCIPHTVTTDVTLYSTHSELYIPPTASVVTVCVLYTLHTNLCGMYVDVLVCGI